MPQPDVFPVPTSEMFIPVWGMTELPQAFVTEIEVPGHLPCRSPKSDSLTSCPIEILKDGKMVQIKGKKPKSKFLYTNFGDFEPWVVQFNIPDNLLTCLSHDNEIYWSEDGKIYYWIPKNKGCKKGDYPEYPEEQRDLIEVKNYDNCDKNLKHCLIQVNNYDNCDKKLKHCTNCVKKSWSCSSCDPDSNNQKNTKEDN